LKIYVEVDVNGRVRLVRLTRYYKYLIAKTVLHHKILELMDIYNRDLCIAETWYYADRDLCTHKHKNITQCYVLSRQPRANPSQRCRKYHWYGYHVLKTKHTCEKIQDVKQQHT